jgi:hypothetical protein
MNHDLDIPTFLRRDPSEIKQVAAHRPAHPRIAYPKHGYIAKGKGKTFRERHKAALRRRAERMIIRRKK